ncbi:hypothetical protein AGOR_G00026980 [Albula goreensis]|uniref:Coiled-coil domain-containing protein 169 n=1 Tax=Albula goreensis TaxID=1534307 RepID=A0A8T3E1Q7_9TELE|nr:hypothetical protein AGOR_G00026980 [Albula goreensis]
MEYSDTDFNNYDLDRLQAELEQEKEMKEMLEVSVSELRGTMVDLENKLHSVEGEENEWRTRYETQLELNGQLEQQIALVREKLEDLQGNPNDRLSSVRSYDDMTVDALKGLLNQLCCDKASLQAKLMDCSMRIIQEAKAYHKANEERRAYMAEISKVSTALDARRKQQMAKPREMLDSRLKKDHNTQTHKRAESEPVKSLQRWPQH